MRNKTKLSSVNSKILTFPSTQYYSTNKLLFPLCKHFFLDWRQQTKNTHTADQQASVWLLLCIMTVGVSGFSVFIWTCTILCWGECGVRVCVLISNPFGLNWRRSWTQSCGMKVWSDRLPSITSSECGVTWYLAPCVLCLTQPPTAGWLHDLPARNFTSWTTKIIEGYL